MAKRKETLRQENDRLQRELVEANGKLSKVYEALGIQKLVDRVTDIENEMGRLDDLDQAVMALEDSVTELENAK